MIVPHTQHLSQSANSMRAHYVANQFLIFANQPTPNLSIIRSIVHDKKVLSRRYV